MSANADQPYSTSLNSVVIVGTLSFVRSVKSQISLHSWYCLDLSRFIDGICRKGWL